MPDGTSSLIDEAAFLPALSSRKRRGASRVVVDEDRADPAETRHHFLLKVAATSNAPLTVSGQDDAIESRSTAIKLSRWAKGAVVAGRSCSFRRSHLVRVIRWWQLA